MKYETLEKAAQLHADFKQVVNDISLWQHITSITIQRNTWTHSSEHSIGQPEKFKSNTEIFKAVKEETLTKLRQRKDDLTAQINDL